MSLGLLIVFSGLRGGVGIDFPAYWDLYRGNEYSQSEAGFRLLCGILTRLGFGPQAMFLATSAIVVVFVYKAAVYYDKTHVCFAFFVFLFAGTFLESLNLVRQYVAIALFFWGSRYIVGRRRQNTCSSCWPRLCFIFQRSYCSLSTGCSAYVFRVGCYSGSLAFRSY